MLFHDSDVIYDIKYSFNILYQYIYITMQISMYTHQYTRSGWLRGRVFASRPKGHGFDPRQGPSRDFSYGHLVLPCVQLLLTVATSLLVFVLNASIANHVSQRASEVV